MVVTSEPCRVDSPCAVAVAWHGFRMDRDSAVVVADSERATGPPAVAVALDGCREDSRPAPAPVGAGRGDSQSALVMADSDWVDLPYAAAGIQRFSLKVVLHHSIPPLWVEQDPVHRDSFFAPVA